MKSLAFRRTRWAVAAAAVLTLATGGLFAITPAHADTRIEDSFEGNPYRRWTVEEEPGRSLAFLGDHQDARTRDNVAWLDAFPPSEFVAWARSTITVARPDPGPVVCNAEVYLRKAGYAGRPDRASVVLRVHAGGRTISDTTVGVTLTAWQRATFRQFAYQDGPITVAIGVYHATVLVDDLTVWCYAEPE